MKSRWRDTVLLTSATYFLLLLIPGAAEAVTRVNGNFFLEDTHATGPETSTNLFQTGLNLNILPPTKKKLKARLSLQLNYTESDRERALNVSPLGNLGLDLGDEAFRLNLQHSQFATVSTTADLVETRISRAALSLSPKDLPRIQTNVSRTESASRGTTTTTDTASLFGDYAYRWLNFRGGYTTTRRESGGLAGQESDSLLLGAGGSYEVLPRTRLSADYDVNRFTSESSTGATTETVGSTVRVNADSRPAAWLQLVGNFSRTETDFDSATAVLSRTTERFVDLTANVDPYRFLRLSATVGNRRFTDVAQPRDIDFTTFAANFHRSVSETVQLAVNASRRYEYDPQQGDNVNDALGVNATMDLTPRIALRWNVNVTRNEVPSFVSTSAFDASGTLEERAAFDDRPAGFTFFDVVNNDLYTKNSSDVGDWSDPVHFEPVTERFSTGKTVQINATPTDKTSLSLTYTSNASSERLDLGDAGSQTLNGSLTYVPNRRTSYGISGTATFPEVGDSSYSGTGTMSYRFLRRHQLSLSYGRRVAAGEADDTVSASLGLALRKQTRVELLYSASSLFQEDRTQFVRVRFSKSF